MFKKLSLEKKLKIVKISQQLLWFVSLFILGYQVFTLKYETEQIFTTYCFVTLFALALIELESKFIRDTLRKDVLQQAISTDLSADDIFQMSKEQKNTMLKHLDTLNNVLKSLNDLKKLATKTKDFAENVSVRTNETLLVSDKEQLSIKANIEKMFTLRQKIQIIAELILELSEHTQQIGSTVGIVEDIAEQTNMLALNAAVEAARAGEHGKGFAVVASEIRKLADESKQATNKIISLISDIQQATNSTVMATEEGSKEIESGVELVQDIDTNINELKHTINKTVEGINEILNSVNHQSNSVIEVTEAIESIDEGLKKSSQNIEKNLELLNNLVSSSKSLKENIGVNNN